ncbi:unnamed protein product [Rangifer tarandus platyrhynchus]|uniref:Uncharacterized protein n=1 Tax=Rangifer tarandus platyrhynchus TaxID=3082113 RepID=A0AC59ZGS7_RANTA
MLAFHTPSTMPPQAHCTCCACHLEYFCASSSPFGSQLSIPSSRKSFLTLPLPLQAGNSRSSLGLFALFFYNFLQTEIFRLPQRLTLTTSTNLLTFLSLCHFTGGMGLLCACVCAKSLQSSLTLCDPVDCSPPGSSVHGTLHARIRERVAMPSSRGSSRPRD